jgi:hypothetical protein
LTIPPPSLLRRPLVLLITLSPATTAYTEGFDTRDLKKAKLLLVELHT